MPRAIVSNPVNVRVATAAKRWKTSTAATTVWRRWLLVCAVQLVCALPTSASEPSDAPSKSILKWSNGDQMAGQVIDANPQALSWNTSLFEEPLQLRLDSLRSITWQYNQPAKLARRGFRVETAQGNLVVGDLIGCDQEIIRLENSNFTVLEIPRKNVRSMVNLAGSAGRWLGPMSIEDWDADRQSKQGLLDTAQGQIVFPQENLIFKKFALKQKTLIDVSFRWAGTLDMKFGFAVPKKWGNLDAPSANKEDSNKELANKEDAKTEDADKKQDSSMVVMKMDPGVLEQLPRLEMFSDAMVLQQKELFDIILEEVDMSSGFLRLVFEWDPPANQLKAFDANGKLLATIALNPLTDDFEPGIFVLNQDGRLTLDNLVVMTLPEEMNPTQEFIATKQGTVVGTVVGFDGKMWSIRRASDQTLVQVAKDDFYMSHVAAVAERTAANDEVAEDSISITKLELRDGSRVAGELQSIADSRSVVLSNVGAQAVTVRLDRAQRLDFPKVSIEQPDAGQADAGTHLLETADGQCHGWLSQEAGASNELLWKPVGSDKAIALLGGGFRIHGTDPTTTQALASIESMPPKNPSGYRDQLYLRNGDRFPANVLRVQSGQVYVEAFQRQATFPTSEVVRCLLGVPSAVRSTLDNPPWQVIENEVKPKLEGMDPGFAFTRYACHPSLLETGGFAITVRGGMNKTKVEVGMAINTDEVISRLQFKLFASEPTDPGTQVYLCVSAVPGNMVSVNLSADPMGDGMHPLSLRATDNIVCSFKVEESELIGSINGKETYRKKLKLSADSTRGVVIGLHDRLPIDAIEQDSRYSVRNAFVRQDSREVALTEPRFVTHQPARSLLIGRNGDLWRADIVSMNDDTVTVRSSGRHLVIERSLVASLLWPDLPPAEETPTEEEPSSEAEQGDAGQANADQTAKEAAKAEAAQPEVPLVPPKPGKLTDVQLVLNDGTKLTLELESWGSKTVIGSSPHYGRIELPTTEIVELRSGDQVVAAADYEGQQWRFKLGKNLPALQKAPEGGQGEGQAGAETAMVGQEAPTFNVKSLDGSDIDLGNYRGKVVVLDFWATWCGYCVEELPGMVAEIAKLPPDKVQLITLDQNEDTETINAWMKEKGLKFVVGLDKDQVAPLYKVNGLPTTYVIDPAGKIVHVKVGGGEGPFQEMMQAIGKLVDEAGPSTSAATSAATTSAPSAPSPQTSSTGVTPPAAPKPDQISGNAVAPQPKPEKPVEKTAPEKPAAQKNALVSVEAHIQPARGDQPALLVVRAKIAEGHKIFSLTQKAGGPVKTKLKMDASESYKLNEFRALQQPKTYPEPSFNNMEVEVHQGVVTWYAPLDIAAGVALESLEVKGKANMQVCNQNNCFAPRDYPFTAKLATKLAEEDAIDLSK